MIVPMKRITLVCLAAERDATLEELRRLGVLHVTDVREPYGASLDDARAELAATRAALEEIERTASRVEEDAAPKRRRRVGKSAAAAEPVAEQDDDRGRRGAPDLVAEVEELTDRRRELQDRADALRRELARVEGFGEFDPVALTELAERGIHVHLAQAAPGARPVAPEGFIVHTLGADKSGVFLAIVAPRPFAVDDLDLGESVAEVRPPEAGPSEMRERLEECRRGISAADRELAGLKTWAHTLKTAVAELTDAERFASVRAGMGVDEGVAYVQGYLPTETVPSVRRAMEAHGWGMVLDDPVPGEPVPTCLRYSRAVRPIRAVLDFLKIYPSYWEADIGWTFLIFFSIFFAMLAGDAVYGLFLVLATVVLQLKFRAKIPGYVFGILYITSILTIIWGMLSGNYVGIGNVPSFLDAVKVEWLQDRDHVIELCFFLGAIQLTIAHVWNAITVRPRTKAIAQIGWVAIIWTMLFLARTMVLGYSLPGWMLYVFAVGVVAVAVFMATPKELKTNVINHALLPLTIIQSFVDVLSYVRLFAVGFATVAVVSAFNMMASSIGWDSVPTAIGAAFVVIIANVLNLVLIALAVLVHAVRLNTLEFSTHKGITWSGQLYEPFAPSQQPAAAGVPSPDEQEVAAR